VIRAWLAVLAFACAGSAAAQSVSSEGVTVHYAALSSSELDPDLARALGILRSPQRLLVNVAVRTGAPGHEVAVPASVAVLVRDPTGLALAPRMRRVGDAGAEYWLGEHLIDTDTRLRFEIEVRVPGRTSPIRAVFAQDFFVAPNP
jgi:hypothetical protein